MSDWHTLSPPEDLYRSDAKGQHRGRSHSRQSPTEQSVEVMQPTAVVEGDVVVEKRGGQEQAVAGESGALALASDDPSNGAQKQKHTSSEVLTEEEEFFRACYWILFSMMASEGDYFHDSYDSNEKFNEERANANGRCTRNACRYVHCSRRDMETYERHGRMTEALARAIVSATGQDVVNGRPICKENLSGHCSRGTRCRFWHIIPKCERDARDSYDYPSRESRSCGAQSADPPAHSARAPYDHRYDFGSKRARYNDPADSAPVAPNSAPPPPALSVPGVHSAPTGVYARPLSPNSCAALVDENISLRKRLDSLKLSLVELMEQNDQLLAENGRLRAKLTAMVKDPSSAGAGLMALNAMQPAPMLNNAVSGSAGNNLPPPPDEISSEVLESIQHMRNRLQGIPEQTPPTTPENFQMDQLLSNSDEYMSASSDSSVGKDDSDVEDEDNADIAESLEAALNAEPNDSDSESSSPVKSPNVYNSHQQQRKLELYLNNFAAVVKICVSQ
ncbi:Zinc finger CCCH domain-containing protein 10, partial [Trichinella spiralis]